MFAPAISGPGALNQLAGTTVLTAADTYTGATTISGGTLVVNGSLGDTSVTVTGGGTLTGTGSIAGPVTVANGGIVNGTGSIAGPFMVDSGGSLNVLSAASFTTSGGSVIGGGPSNGRSSPNNGFGVATISGPGSTWTNTGSLFVGGFVDASGTIHPGTGMLTIADGGKVTTTGGNPEVPDGIGGGAGSIGNAVVTGAGSQLTVAHNFGVGIVGGTGTLTVENGGAVAIDGITGVGLGIDQFLGGSGALNVLSGGTVTTNVSAFLGAGEATGIATVSGAGSTWSINGPLFVGGQPDLQLGPGAGTVNIADGGIVRATGGVTLAPEAGSFGTLNIGAAPGSPPVAPGTLDTPTVTFGDGTGVINFNHTATDYVFAPAISGPGAVNQLAGTTILTAANTYTGATTITGGVLVVDGSLGDTPVVVTSGGTLSGSGSIAGPVTIGSGGKLAGTSSIAGPVTVANGGVIAPGNSIGTLTLGGNYVQDPGSTYEVELGAPGQSDLIAVGGQATLGGRVEATFVGGFTPTLGNSYTILTAGGGILGTYSSVTAPSGVFGTPRCDISLPGAGPRLFVHSGDPRYRAQ